MLMHPAASVLLFSAVVPSAVLAQQATISRELERLTASDTTVAVWLFARPGTSLDQVRPAVIAAGANLRRSSRWLNAVSAEAPSRILPALRRITGIRHIQPVRRFRGPPPQPAIPAAAPAAPPTSTEPIDSVFGSSAMPIRVLDIFPLSRLNLRGQGVKIAILDTGFDTDRSVFAATTIIGQRDFIFDDDVVRNEPADAAGADDHGTGTWSLLAASQTGTMVGVAPDAEYILAKTEDVRGETRVEEDNYVAALEWADSLGANIVSSSLSYLGFEDGTGYQFSQLDGDVAVTTVAADEAARRGITVVTAMGNSGPGIRTISTPADADSVISAGAVDSLDNLAPFSSRGPTADNRIKPDLTAPGVSIFIATPTGATATGFTRSNGTSFSTPLLAGAAALMKQVHPGFGPIEIRDALRRAGSNARAPDPNRGWGTPDVGAAVTFPEGITLTDPATAAVTTATPRFSWVAPQVPAFALPLTYRLTVARDTAFSSILLDTSVSGTELVSPRSFSPGSAFYVRLAATAANGVTVNDRPLTRFIVTGTGEMPPITLLFQNFPNPFPERPSGQSLTCIWFDLATAGTVRLDILDLRGHLVRNLVPGSAFEAELPAGRYGRPAPTAMTGCHPDFTWDGTTADGRTVPQGIYLVKLATPDGVYFRRIAFLGLP